MPPLQDTKMIQSFAGLLIISRSARSSPIETISLTRDEMTRKRYDTIWIVHCFQHVVQPRVG